MLSLMSCVEHENLSSELQQTVALVLSETAKNISVNREVVLMIFFKNLVFTFRIDNSKLVGRTLKTPNWQFRDVDNFPRTTPILEFIAREASEPQETPKAVFSIFSLL